MLSNYFIGDVEYIIRFQDGIHKVKRVDWFGSDPDDFELVEVFRGFYSNCLSFLDETRARFLETYDPY